MVRVPIWRKNQRFLEICRKSVEYSWTGAIFQIPFFALIAYGFVFPSQPVGMAMAALSIAAIIMTVRSMTAIEKVGWVTAACGLFLVELRSITAERQESNRIQEEQRQAFSSVLSDNQRRFDATMNRFAKLTSQSQTMLGQVTGGDSFAYFLAVPNYGVGSPPTFPLTVLAQGRYPMSDVAATVQPFPIQDFEDVLKSIRTVPLGSGTILPGAHLLPDGFRIPLGTSAFTITSRNRQWVQEEIILAMTDGHVSQTVVVWADGKVLYSSPAGLGIPGTRTPSRTEKK